MTATTNYSYLIAWLRDDADLDASGVETLVRLAATTACDGWDDALTSFSEPDEVAALARRVAVRLYLPADYIEHATAAYLTCALWSSTGDDSEPLDAAHTPDDVDDDSREAAHDTVAAFVADQVGILSRREIAAAQCGHDLWLTRNGHGAGFWDRGNGADGDALADAARSLGSSDAHVGDNDRVYLS